MSQSGERSRPGRRMALTEKVAALPEPRVRAEWSGLPRTAFLCIALGCMTQLPPGLWLLLLDHKRGRRSLVSVSFMGSVLVVESLIHASPLHAPHNPCSAFFPPLSLWFALQIFQPSSCSSSFGSVLVPLVRHCVCSCFSSSGGGFSRLPYPFLFSLAPPFPAPTPFSFVVYSKLKTKQIRIPPMHLTVQTERSAGVAAGAGARG